MGSAPGEARGGGAREDDRSVETLGTIERGFAAGVCRRLRALPGLAEVPVIFLSARVRDEEEPEDPSLGPVTHVSKPFDPQELVGLVRRTIGGAGG